MSGAVSIDTRLPLIGLVAAIGAAVVAVYSLDTRVAVLEAKSAIIEKNIQDRLDKIDARLSKFEDKLDIPRTR